MPFVKITKRFKGMKGKVGDIILIEEEEIKDGISVDTNGIEYPTDCLAELTEEEKADCLKEEEIPL